jgi:acetoacetyl-[acyl-carrier protein] synthase
MARLPVIVSFGGFNAAGRSSFHQGYQRVVIDSLGGAKQQDTLVSLAVMMGRVYYDQGQYCTPVGDRLTAAQVVDRFGADIINNTLIRRIGAEFFDVDKVPTRYTLTAQQTEQQIISFELPIRHLPDQLPANWQVSPIDSRKVRVQISGQAEIGVLSHYASPVQAAGQLPQGFNPAALYHSHFHPRALQLSVIAASDAINAMGISWQTVIQQVSPEQIGCYSSSVASQLDNEGLGGLLQARLRGERVTSKQLALGLSSMPADFVNAYVIGNLGSTASIAGACASFLYNLKAAVSDIQAGRVRVAVVGSAEAPITPEIIEGFTTMGALATTEKLCKLDSSDTTDLRFCSRPFGQNCGFVIGEASQYVILMDDELALTLGADIHGAISDVFINADGFKKSISAPGPGNYITFAKAVASARSLLGDKVLAQRSFVQAHGSSTPQNRTTESALLSQVATVFGIEKWPVTAVKAFVGHTLGPASGDQLINTLGVFAQGILPGITTISSVADDVVQKGLSISNAHRHLDNPMDVAFLNSKGFGGNNATASVLSPQLTESMLAKRHGQKLMAHYQSRRDATRQQAQAYNQQFSQGNHHTIYNYGQNMLDESDIEITTESIRVSGYSTAIDLQKENLYKDML